MDKWMTKEEFFNNPVDGYCFIFYNGYRLIANYCVVENQFNNIEDDYSPIENELVTHVMPIDTPMPPQI